MVGQVKMKLGVQVGLGPIHIAFDGDPDPPKKGTAPQCSAHVRCGQMAGWIRMPLGMEVGLGPGDFVLYGDPDPPPKRGVHSPSPIFRTCLLWPNGWMDQDVTWHGGRPWPRRLCVRWGPSPPPKRGTAPNFRPMSIVAKQLDGLICRLVWR